jgi:regulator of replication initiation timing
MSSATQDSQAGSAAFSAGMSGITPPSMPGRQGAFLSDIIVELGFADREVVEDAVPAAASAGKTIGRFMLDRGVISDEQLSIAIAERSGLEHVDLDSFAVDASAAPLIGRSVAMRYNALPIAFAPDGALVVAVADPSDFLGISDIEVMAKTEVRLAIANPERIQELVERLPDAPEPLPDVPEPPEPFAYVPEAPETFAYVPEAPEPSPDVQADPVAAPEEVRTADTNGSSAGDGAAIAEREDERDQELDQLRRRLADGDGLRERLREEFDQLHRQLADATGERDRLRQEIELAAEEQERLGGELDQLRRRLADGDGERDRLGQELELATAERERLGRELELAAEERERPPTEAQGVEPCVDRTGGEVPLAEAEPLNTVAFDQVTLNMKKGTATVRARVEGVGHLLLTGKGVQDSFAATDGMGSATLAVVPTGKRRRKLEATGRAKVEVSVMFVPASGDLRTQAMAITLVKRMDQ